MFSTEFDNEIKTVLGKINIHSMPDELDAFFVHKLKSWKSTMFYITLYVCIRTIKNFVHNATFL